MSLQNSRSKRGPKAYDPKSNRLMPISMIAKRLGVSCRTVHYDLIHAMRKLSRDGGLQFIHLMLCECGSITVKERSKTEVK